MGTKHSFWFVSAVFLALGAAAAAGESTRHSGASARHSAAAFGHGVRVSAGLVSAAVAVPLIAGGTVGTASGEAGRALWEAGTGEPLPIAEQTIIDAPNPAQALGLPETPR